jgi:hypothetical protein
VYLQAKVEPSKHLIANHMVIRELSIRYEKQQRRWHNYSKLFGFFAFVILFLAVLWLQRGAQTGYAVQSAIRTNIIDVFEVTSINSASEVLPWLRTVLETHWKDATCGDGKCQEPFEFPSYSRFGCRADCSTLTAVTEGLFPLQVCLFIGECCKP